jgi:hypothetical protein
MGCRASSRVRIPPFPPDQDPQIFDLRVFFFVCVTTRRQQHPGISKAQKLISKYLTIFSMRLTFKTNVNFDFLNQACFDGGFISLKLIKKT